MATFDPSPSSRVPPKYRLVRVLGSGSMGTVLLARDLGLGRLVALKFLRECCAVFLERFRREARLMARLDHPAIVRVHEMDVWEGRSYLAMEYLDGGNLALLRAPPLRLVRTLRPLVDALHHAHLAGVVHRDVKPENVLLDRSGRAVLGDFGLALDPDEGESRHAGRPVVGTPLTMSPEQARGEVVTPRSDIFSLGTTLYQKLAGVWPFRGRTVPDVLRAIQLDAPLDPRRWRPDIPSPLAQIVLRCLEKDVDARFSSMAELGTALDRVITPRRRFGTLRRTGTPHPAASGPLIHPEEL